MPMNQPPQGMDLSRMPNFKVVQEDDPAAFEKQLNILFRSGWKCQGINHTTNFDESSAVHKTRYIAFFEKSGLGN